MYRRTLATADHAVPRRSTTCDVRFLPTHFPTDEQRENPAAFAAAVRGKLEAALQEPWFEML